MTIRSLSKAAGVASLPFLFAAAAVSAENWPQWRGPSFNGSSPAKDLPVIWGRTDNVAWVTPLPGPGAATPAVWGNRIFVSAVGPAEGSTQAGTRETLAICIDRADGRVVWRKRVGVAKKLRGANTCASPSPVTDGRRAYFMFGTGDLLAVDFSGRIVWQRNLTQEDGDFLIKFGYGGSPLLHDGKLYVSVIQNDKSHRGQTVRGGPLGSYLLAVDAGTGRVLWRRSRPSNALGESKEAYTTPVLRQVGKRSEILVMGADCLTGHDPADGRELWRWDGYNPQRKKSDRLVVSPVAGSGTAGPGTPEAGLIYVAAPRGRTLYAVRAPGDERHVVWETRGNLPDVCTPALYDGRLYVLCGARKVMTCIDPATGQKKWVGRLGGRAVYYASPTAADGKIYCIDVDGSAVVLAAGDSFKVLSRASMGEGPCHSTIVAAGGQLFIRTARNLYCIGK